VLSVYSCKNIKIIFLHYITTLVTRERKVFADGKVVFPLFWLFSSRTFDTILKLEAFIWRTLGDARKEPLLAILVFLLRVTSKYWIALALMSTREM